jgi:hypothetical protein
MLLRHGDPIERIPGVHNGLMGALLEAMATDPADRPTAAGFRDLLSDVDLDPPHLHARRAAPPATAAADAGSDAFPTGQDSPAQPKALAGATELTERSVPAGEAGQESWPESGERKDDQRARRRRGGILVAAAVVLVSAVSLSLISLLPRPVARDTPVASPVSSTSAERSPSGEMTAASSPTGARTRTPTPPEANVPANFKDCSDELGKGTYCTPEPECWGGVSQLYDALMLALPADCDENHVHQTFAAGSLNFTPVRQSTLEADSQVKKVCKAKVVNRMLDEDERRSDWEVHALPPQAEGETFYRCIFGRGQRTQPFQLSRPD